MAGNTIYSGNGSIVAGDYKAVSWTGKTKQGKAVTIAMSDAINLGDIDLSFAEKDDTVASITFTACYLTGLLFFWFYFKHHSFMHIYASHIQPLADF